MAQGPLRIRPTDEASGQARGGVVVEVSGMGRPRCRWETPGGYRLRLTVGDQPRLWARCDDWDWKWQGALARRRGDLLSGVLPPISAEEARRAARSPSVEMAWMRWFARALHGSPASPLHDGLFRLAPIPTAKHGDRWPMPAVPRPPTTRLPPATIADPFDPWAVREAAGAPEGEVLCLRAPARHERARIKALGKLVRDRALAPVLLWYVDALRRYVVLDGHLRLAAALEADVKPLPLLALFAIEPALLGPDDEGRARLISSAEDALGRAHPDVPLANALAQVAFRPKVATITRTRAWLIPGGITSWLQSLASLDRPEAQTLLA